MVVLAQQLDLASADAQPVFKSQHTGLLTYCVQYQTDRGVPFDKAVERLKKEVRPGYSRISAGWAAAKPSTSSE